jgi:hypothetical protein
MTYTVEQRGETQRLEALLRELRPIEARCLPMSDECLRAIEICRLREIEEDENDGR